MNITMNSIFFLFLCFFIKLNAQTLIKSSCKSFARDDPNINYNFCSTSLQAAPASQCATLHGLGTISIRLVRYNVTDTRCQVKQLLKNERISPYVRACLHDCFELYSNAIDYVKQGMKSFNAGRFDDANIQISAVLDSATTCEDGFSERKGVVSPLMKRNNDTFQLAAIALSVLNRIQTGSVV